MMLRSLLLTTAVTLSMTGMAIAADAFEPIDEVIADPMFDWSGFYIGAHAGYGWAENDLTFDDGFAPENDNIRGWLLGLQAGYNHQVGAFVLGIEGDVSWANLTGQTDDLNPDAGDTFFNTTTISWISTLRGRIGGLVDESLLLYGTAGVAAAGYSQFFSGDDGGAFTTDTASGTLYGVVVGVGAEAMVTDNVSIKGEYLFHYFGAPNDPFAGIEGPSDLTSQISVSTIKIGANLHF